MSARFGRDYRLLSQTDFSRVFQDPRKSTDRWLTVLASPNRFERPRLGLAISRKNARRAVQRNRIKRVMRESFRLNQNQLTGLDIVILSRREAGSASKRQLRSSIERHWTRITKS